MLRSDGQIRGFILALILIWGGAVFFRLGGLPFTGADEPRYARIAEEMQADGRWVTPVLEGRPWLEKPPLYYWITIPWFAAAGPSEAAARTGPALCALISALAVFFLGARFRSAGTGFLASCILLTSIGIPAFGRSASTDMPFTACLTVSLSFLAAAAAGRGYPRWKTALGYVFLGLAVLAKGPVALVLIAGIAALFWTLDDRGGSLRRMLVPEGLVLTLAVAAPWFVLAFQQNGYSFITTFLINHNLARYVSDIHHHTQPVYYFVPVLLGLLFPWSGWLAALWPGSISARLRAWRDWDPMILFLTCWFLVPFVFFSLSKAKLAGYILPSIPPLALLLAAGLQGCFRTPGPNRRLKTAAWIQIALSAGVAAAFPMVLRQRYGGDWKDGIPLALAVFLPAVASLWAALRLKWRVAVGATAFQGLLLIITLTQAAFPVLAQHHSTRDISRLALAAREAAEPIVTYRFFHHTFFYYTRYEGGRQLMDAPDLVRFAGEHRRFLVVTEAKREEEVREAGGLAVAVRGRQGRLLLLEIKKPE